MIVECYDCLWNVTIGIGMLRLVWKCYDCFWNVTTASGMLRLVWECCDCLWNVTTVCRMRIFMCHYTINGSFPIRENEAIADLRWVKVS